MSQSVNLSNAICSVSGITDASIYDVSFDINFTSPSSFNVSFVNESGVYTKPVLDSENPQTLTIGSTRIKVYPVSYKIEKSGSGKLLVVQYVDSGVKYLDKYLVSLKDIKNPRVLNLVNVLLPNSGEGAFETGGYLLSQLLQQIKDKRIPISKSAESFLTNSNSFISGEEYQKVFVLEETGRLRDVLSSYGAKVGCIFFWNFLTEQLDAISLRRGINKTETEALASQIETTYGAFSSTASESASILDSSSKSLILYDTYGGQSTDRGIFCDFDRVIVETDNRIPWVRKLQEITEISANVGNNPIPVRNNLIKMVYAKRISSLSQYIFSELVADAINNDRLIDYSDSSTPLLPDTSGAFIRSESNKNETILKSFPNLTVCDFVQGSLSEHYNTLKNGSNYNLFQAFVELTGAKETSGLNGGSSISFDGIINEENTNGRPFYICVVQNDFLASPLSDKMERVEDLIGTLSETYNTLFVSRRKFTRTDVARFSLKYGSWYWSKQNVDEISKLEKLKKIIAGSQSSDKVAFDPFYKELVLNSQAQVLTTALEDEMAESGSDKLYGRMFLDLELGESKFPSEAGKNVFLSIEEAVQKASPHNIGIQKIRYEAPNTSFIIVFEDAAEALQNEVRTNFSSILPSEDVINRKFILSGVQPTSLLYKYRLSNLESPSCISNDLQVLKAPSVSDVNVVTTENDGQFLTKIDLQYMLDFIEAQGGFLIPENSVTFNYSIEKLVELNSSWLKNGLEGLRVRIGSGGVTCDVTVSDKKKLFQGFDEIARVINIGHNSFASTIRLRSSLPLFGPQIGNMLFK